MLGLRAQDPTLELAAALHHLEIQPPILVALPLSERELLLELVESKRDLGDVAHAIFLILSRSSVNSK
jgi:hypothetical protein